MKKQNIDWDALGFGVYPTRSMWKSTCPIDGDWTSGGLIPYGNIEISPAAGVLNYGQGVFEGMKAYHSAKNRIVLFRPDMNGKRIANSSKRFQKFNHSHLGNSFIASRQLENCRQC